MSQAAHEVCALKMINRAMSPAGAASPLVWIAWALAATICLFTLENIWVDPWLRSRWHRIPSLVPDALGGAWVLTATILGVILALLATCQILLMKETNRPRWQKLLSGMAVVLAALLFADWIAVTSGAVGNTRSLFLPKPRAVTLHWEASTSDVVGYNIYRGTAHGIHDKKLNFAPVKELTYTDNDVKSGVKYYYVARAVDGSGNESGDSNESSVKVP
jgi:hypothetical protein